MKFDVSRGSFVYFMFIIGAHNGNYSFFLDSHNYIRILTQINIMFISFGNIKYTLNPDEYYFGILKF